MPIKDVYTIPEALHGQIVDVVDVVWSRDGSCKLIQAVNAGPVRATFETGRYTTADGEKVCVSSQLGCDMGCTFCVTGKPFEYVPNVAKTKLRDLTVQEMVAEVENALFITPPRPSGDLTFSFMGMGEPFANLANVKKTIIELGNRYPRARATISTIGHNLTGIRQLAQEIDRGKYPIPVRLHVSVHGSRDDLRREIVPYAKPLNETLDAAQEFARITQSDVKLNYVLVAGQNASEDDACRLGSLLKGRTGLVMKISKLNAPGGIGVVSDSNADSFERIIQTYGISTYRFASMGTDIQAGCGELAKGKRTETILALVRRKKDGRILLQKRTSSVDYGETWSFISGKVGQGEHVENAFTREVREESRLKVKNDGVIYLRLSPFIYESPDKARAGDRYLVHPFLVEIESDDIPGGKKGSVPRKWVTMREIFEIDDIAPPLKEEIVVFKDFLS